MTKNTKSGSTRDPQGIMATLQAQLKGKRSSNESRPVSDEQYQAIVRRDPGFDGKVFYGVVTTGVFCRPSCSARTPNQRNVCVFDDYSQAIQAGFRPCMRCRPTSLIGSSRHLKVLRKVCRYIRDHSDESLTLDDLSAVADMSPTHLQKVFSEEIGVSPRVYLEACRFQHFKGLLRGNSEVGEAIVEAGFGSASRVYEKLDWQLGMTPREYQGQGKGVCISYAYTTSEFGLILIAATDRGVCFVQFGESESDLVELLKAEFPKANLSPIQEGQVHHLKEWLTALEDHMKSRPQTVLQLPVDISGTAFQVQVWRYLTSIPPGEVRSYGQVAKAIGRPKSVRAVATACAANCVALLIPCHRVIRGTGELGGYRWGVERKRALLDQEREGCS